LKVLFFTPALPLPPFSGGQVRSLNLLKQISSSHEVTLFSFVRQANESSHLEELKKIVREVRVFPRRSLNSFANIRHLASLPFAAALYYDDKVAQVLREELKKGYDIAHFESFYTLPYLKGDLGVKTVAGNENIEYLIYDRYSETKRALTRSLMKMDIARMKRFEEDKWRQSDVSLSVSSSDQKIIASVTGKESPLIPNGIDLSFFEKVSRREEKALFLFVGPTKYIQNADAAKWLVKDIWPEIKSQIPEAKLWFVGHQQQDWLLNLRDTDIRVQTDLGDIRTAYEKATILIAPLRAGSGTKFKILEAFAAGVPVLTTKVGIEGIEAVDGESFLLAQSPEEFARKSKTLLEDRVLNAKIVVQARGLVAQKYSWKKIGQELNEVYSQLTSSK
jgi:glycosyltransferase involved in cell wall biosynthesis